MENLFIFNYRRLITNFFRERDCFTMIRPTESESDLQVKII